MSDNTINRRIQELSGDINKQVVAANTEEGKFILQLDDSANVSDDAQLLVYYVRYQGKSGIKENFLLCKRLERTTVSEDLSKLADSFIKEGLRWDHCFNVCSDGAPAMLRARQGFTTRIKLANPALIFPRENLASRKTSRA